MHVRANSVYWGIRLVLAQIAAALAQTTMQSAVQSGEPNRVSRQRELGVERGLAGVNPEPSWRSVSHRCQRLQPLKALRVSASLKATPLAR
jgi:hypothetical protein